MYANPITKCVSLSLYDQCKNPWFQLYTVKPKGGLIRMEPGKFELIWTLWRTWWTILKWWWILQSIHKMAPYYWKENDLLYLLISDKCKHQKLCQIRYYSSDILTFKIEWKLPFVLNSITWFADILSFNQLATRPSIQCRNSFSCKDYTLPSAHQLKFSWNLD